MVIEVRRSDDCRQGVRSCWAVVKIETFFIPEEIDGTHSICILIDAIRASCTISTLFEKNVSQVILTEDEHKSLQTSFSEDRDELFICAEKVEGSKSDLAHASPSLAELESIDIPEQQRVLFKTTNGTQGILKLRKKGVETILIGSMLNKEAVIRKALSLASEKDVPLNIVCAGRENGRIYCIDDTYCSAKLIEYALVASKELGIGIELQDSALIALGILKNYVNTEDAFSKSATGNVMRLVGSERDIALCARDSISTIVPRVGTCDNSDHITIEKE